MGRDSLSLVEEKFDIYKSTRTEGTFLDYVEEFDKYTGDVTIEEDPTDSGLGKED